MGKKVFRHTPHRAANAMKIIVGNKTNATIRDLEETEEDVEEIEGVVISIDKDKINGDGWTVQDSEGNIYQCNCASNMYQLPETEEYGGVYYPTDTVTVKITKNPVLRNNTITEITSLGEDDKTLDLSQWKHGDKETTIIAKPKSAISISNGLISFNYNNTNEVKVDEEAATIEGAKTVINTEKMQINSDDINIYGESLDEYLARIFADQLAEQYQTVTSNVDEGVDAMRQNNMGQLDIKTTTYIPLGHEKIITDLKDPSMAPESRQKHTLLAGNDIDELYIYPNGLVTVQARGVPNKKDIFHSLNWITSQHNKKNILNIRARTSCKCCDSKQSGVLEYFNYCPKCKTWNTLSELSSGYITCNSCHSEWCAGCGHIKNVACGNKTYNLKKYPDNMIMVIGSSCDYCKNSIDSGKIREYANYCPQCQAWGKLKLNTRYDSYGNEVRTLQCECGKSYCTNCSISQGTRFISSFLDENKDYYYNDFVQKYKKMTHIRDD